MNAVTGGSPFVPAPGIGRSSSPSSKEKGEASPSPCKEAFIPCGGKQNRFLNRLVADGILDANYRLAKTEASPSCLPIMDCVQLEIVRDFLNSEVSITIPFQTGLVTRSFKLFQLLNRLLRIPSVNCERIEIVGGLLRRILLCSPSFARDAIEQLGVRDPKSLAIEELLDNCSSNLPDADIRFRLASGEATVCTNGIVSFIGELFGGLDSHWIRKLAFNKFHYLNFGGTEFSIASFGTFLLQKLSSRPSELECLFAKSFARENLFLHDGIKANITPLLHAGEDDWTLQIEGTGRQALIDNLGKVIHIDNPKSVNVHGFPMLISYLSRGYVLGDDAVVDTSGKPEKVGVLETLRTTFLKPFGKYQSVQEQLPKLVVRCLQNHHPDDPSAPLVFLCNLQTELEEHGSDQLLHSAWKLISTEILSQGWKEEASGFLALLAEALFEKNIPFSVVISTVLLAGLTSLKSVSDDEKNPLACLKKHREKPFLQIRVESAGNGHLLLPFSPEAALKTLSHYFEEGKCTKDQTVILKKLFATLLKKEGGPAPASTLLDACRPFFQESFTRLANDPKTSCIDASSPLHFFAIPVQASVCIEKKPLQQIFMRLPEVLYSTSSHAERIALYHHFLQGLAHSPYEYLTEKLTGLTPYLQKKKASGLFLGKWMEVLAKSGEREMVDASLVLWQTFKQKFPPKKRKSLSLRLTAALLPASPRSAQRLAHDMQHDAEAPLSGQEEAALLAQLMRRCQTQSGQELDIPGISELLTHYLNRTPSQVAREFRQAAQQFLEKIIDDGNIREGAKLLEQLVELAILPPGSSALARLWTKLFSGEKAADRSYTYWERANTLNIWKEQPKNPAYIPAIVQIAEKLLDSHCHASKGYLLLQHLVKRKIQKQHRSRIRRLVKSHLSQLLRKSDLSSNDRASRLALDGYKRYLTPVESSAYLVQLLQRYAEDGETEKALLLWKRAVKFGDLKTVPELAHATEKLLQSFLACPTGCSGALKMLASPRFPVLTPGMTPEWIGIAAKLLESAEGAHNERIIVLRLALPRALENSDSSLPLLVSFLRTFLTCTPADSALLDLVRGQTEKILTALHASHQPLELCGYLEQLIELEACPPLEKTTAQYCLEAMSTLAGSPLATKASLDLCEKCLRFLHSQHPTETEALTTCYWKLSGALYKKGKSKRGFSAAKALTLLDKQGRREEAYSELCLQVQQRNLKGSVDLLELFTSAYKKSKAFHGIIAALPAKFAKCQPLEQINYYLKHRDLLLQGHTCNQLNRNVTELVHRANLTPSSGENIRSCLLAFKEYQPTLPEPCVQLLETAVFCEDPPLMKMAWEVFEGILADSALFAEAADQHIHCWRLAFELLHQQQSPEIHTLVKSALIPESSIGRPFGECAGAEAKAENILVLLRYALSLLKKEIGMTGSNLKNLIELFRRHFPKPLAEAAAFERELAFFLVEGGCKENFPHAEAATTSLLNLLCTPEPLPTLNKLIDLYTDRILTNPNLENLTRLQRVLGHEALHTCPRRSSMLWWRMISMSINVLDRTEHSQHALASLISSYEKVKHHPESLDCWANEVLDRILLFLNEEHTVINFNQQFLSFFRKIVEDPDLLDMDVEVILNSTPIYSLYFKRGKVIPKEINHRFFSYMNLLIQKILQAAPANHRQYLIRNHFVCYNLPNLITLFPCQSAALASTIRQFTLWITPDECERFQIHILYAGEIYAAAVKENIFSQHPRYFIEGLMFLDAKTSLPPSITFADQVQILYDLSNRLLQLNSPHAALRVVQILKGVQGIIAKAPNRLIQKIYEKLIDMIDQYPTFSLDGTYFFEFVRSALMQSETFLFFDGSKESFTQARSLCSRLCRTTLRVITEKRFEGHESALAGWLIRFHHFAAKYGAYVGIEANKEYFNMVKAILPFALRYLDTVDEHQREDFITCTFLTIYGIEDSKTDICRYTRSNARTEYSKHLKIKRARLLVRWIKTLAASKDKTTAKHAKAQYKVAKDEKLLSYKCVRREKKELDALLE